MKHLLLSSLRLGSAVFLAASMGGSAVAAIEYTQGNGFYYGSAGSASASTSTGQYASFTATRTTQATSLNIYLNTTNTTVTWGLQRDDGTGKPDGNFIADAFGTTAVTTGWNTLALPDLPLTEGSVYHVVLNPVASGSGSALWRLLNGSTAPGTQPYGVIDPHFARGSIKAAGPDEPVTTGAVVYYVDTNEGDGFGQPYYSTSTISTSAPRAQQFIFRAGETGSFLETVTLRLTTGAVRPTEDVTVTLLDASHSVLETVTLSRNDLLLGAADNYTLTLSGSTQLVDGNTYMLAVYGGSENATRWNIMQTIGGERYASATFQGTAGYAFNYADPSFSEITSTDLLSDYVFTYTTIPEPGAVVLGLLGAGALILGRQRLRLRR